MIPATARGRVLLVVMYAIGMAWVESACVYYLRVLVGGIDPARTGPLAMPAALGAVELVREAATLVMLFAIGWLAGGALRSRIAYTAIAFGVWDVLYYAFLRAMCGWPTSLLDWDLLFLLPLPWWGPVLAPVSIAILMIVWGVLVAGHEPGIDHPRTSPWWPSACLGIALALYVFMADALHALSRGGDHTTIVVPTSFNWAVFLIAIALIAVPVADLARRVRPRIAA